MNKWLQRREDRDVAYFRRKLFTPLKFPITGIECVIERKSHGLQLLEDAVKIYRLARENNEIYNDKRS